MHKARFTPQTAGIRSLSHFHARRGSTCTVRAKPPAAPAPPAGKPRFDLALAVALAGAAFEAYLVPTGAEGRQEVAVNGTETTYTDRCACT